MSSPVDWLLGAAELVFGGAVWARERIYAAGLVRVARATRPVISVGNLTVGGNGKTPLVIEIVRRLTRRRVTSAVLSRGYGARRRSRGPLVVSDGVSAAAAGDEPVLIARKTGGRVVVSPDRAAGARLAVEQLGADVLVLDDGFQHWRLARDLEIVLLDAALPFGNGHLLPRGTLRERPRALGRCQLAVVHHGVEVQAGWRRPPELPLGVPVVHARARAEGFGPVGDWLGPAHPAEQLAGRRVALLSGIARPERFADTVRRLGGELVHHRALADHAWLDGATLARFGQEARAAGAERLLTTEKDAARLEGAVLAGATSLGLEALAVRLELVEGEGALESALDELLPRGSAPAP